MIHIMVKYATFEYLRFNPNAPTLLNLSIIEKRKSFKVIFVMIEQILVDRSPPTHCIEIHIFSYRINNVFIFIIITRLQGSVY